MARRFLEDSLALALSQYLSRAILLARGLAAAVALGPAGLGGWNALSLVLDYGAYASVGALQGLDLELPAAVQRGDRERERRLLTGAAWAVALGGALLSLIVLSGAALGVRALTGPWGFGAPALMLVAAWLQLAIQYFGSALRARGDFRTVSAAQAAQALVGGGLGLLLVGRAGVWGLLGGWLAGSILALALLWRAAPDTPLASRQNGMGFELARAGLPVFGFFALSVLLRSVDRLALVRFGRPEDLGRYSIALMAAGLVLYLPEAVAAVLYPRITAAASGARDAERTRGEAERAHLALAALLPPAVGAAIVWVGPAVARLLPEYRGSVEAVRVLALGALLLAAGTVPGYWLLGRGRSWTLLKAGGAAALASAVLVFAVAARDPEPGRVAWAAAAGYALFAATMVTLAAPTLGVSGGRAGFVAASFLPGLWVGAVALAACRVGDPTSVPAALVRTLVVVLAAAPALWTLRGAGIGAALRTLAGRAGS